MPPLFSLLFWGIHWQYVSFIWPLEKLSLLSWEIQLSLMRIRDSYDFSMAPLRNYRCSYHKILQIPHFWFMVWNMLFCPILGIIISIDSYFSELLKPPTRFCLGKLHEFLPCDRRKQQAPSSLRQGLLSVGADGVAEGRLTVTRVGIQHHYVYVYMSM